MRIGFAVCGSFCSFEKMFKEMINLSKKHEIVPIMSEIAYSTDTRFGKAEDWRRKIEELCGRKIIHTVVEAEPLGPKRMVDILLIEPCTGNTAAKLSGGITDTSVTMAAKSVLRVATPVVLTVATNDGLGAAAENIGRLLNRKNYFFTPLAQDDPKEKPTSLVADFTLTEETLLLAAERKQIQPIYR